MSDKILESGTVHVQDIQMGKKKTSDVKIANDEVLFIIFYHGRGIINAFGEEIFMSEKERDFIRYYGTTPAAISKIKKLEEAKRLLATTTYSMKEIAVKLKYKSHTHFGMDFKNNTGMTPAEYRKAIKAKREKQMNTKDYQMNLKDYLAKMC